MADAVLTPAITKIKVGVKEYVVSDAKARNDIEQIQENLQKKVDAPTNPLDKQVLSYDESSKKWIGVKISDTVINGTFSDIILTDKVTGDNYALIVENATLALLGVGNVMPENVPIMVDHETGKSYTLTLENKNLFLVEVVE